MWIEVLLAAALLAVALVPFALRARRVFGLSWLAGSVVLGLVAWVVWDPASRLGEAAVLDRPVQVDTREYATSGSCRSCHPHEYGTWHDSYHRRMTQVASPETVVGDFENVSLTVYGEEYFVERRGDEFWVDQPGTFEPGNPPRVQKQVVMVTGSHHYQIYWLPAGRGRELELFQFVFKLDEQMWMPIDEIFVLPEGVRMVSDQKGQWNNACAGCHTTRPRPRIEGGEVDTQVSEFGITCEACHGPGEEHVRVNQNPARRYWSHLTDRPDPTIANPARLAADRSSQICSQCHAVRDRDAAGLREQYNREGLPYRPGEDLEKVMPLKRTGLDAMRFWPDGNSHVSGREFNGLAASPCFDHGDESRPVLACVDCHQMHQAPDDPRPRKEWAADQLGVGMRTNAACVGCHPAFADEESLTAHTFHAADSSGSGCTNCHMPHTNYGLLKATRSHTITSPDVAVELRTGRPNACNMCHLDQTLAWTADALEERYGLPRPTLTPDQENVSAAVLHLLSGDAAQRALVAWRPGGTRPGKRRERAGRSPIWPSSWKTRTQRFASSRTDRSRSRPDSRPSPTRSAPRSRRCARRTRTPGRSGSATRSGSASFSRPFSSTIGVRCARPSSRGCSTDATIATWRWWSDEPTAGSRRGAGRGGRSRGR